MPREVTHLLIGAVYHPPKANNFELLDYLTSSMDEVTRRTDPHTGILLLGDFNQLPDAQLRYFPLQQIVSGPTRGNSTLDKIYTNVATWFQIPITIPAVSRSDHEIVCLQPAADPLPRPTKSAKVIHRRLISPNRKALLFNQLQRHNWTCLFQMNSCEEIVHCFWLDYYMYMPVVINSVDSRNKPWVTRTLRRRSNYWIRIR